MTTTAERRRSRAVERQVQPGSNYLCPVCDKPVKFQARQRRKVVICNVYKRGRWDRVETYHPDCYEEAGAPHGEVDRTGSDLMPRPR